MDVIHIALDEANVVPRSYGRIRHLAGDDTGLRNLHTVVVEIDAGEQTSKHYHPFEEVFFVLEGSGMFSTLEGSIGLRPNDAVSVPANETHQISNNSRQKCVLFVAMSPPRKPSEVRVVD